MVKDGELWLINAHIGVYEHGNIFNHEPLRTRKLLVHRSELNKLIGKTQQKGLTLIPTRLYFRNGKVKVEIALAKGKQHVGQTRDRAPQDRRQRSARGIAAAENRNRAYRSDSIMKIIILSYLATPPSQFETECLVVAVIDAAEKSDNGANDKPKPQLLTDDAGRTR